MKYYKITVKHGHHGTKQYMPITFYIEATDIFSAQEQAKRMPGVKHTCPVLGAMAISKEEYEEGRRAGSAYRNFK